MLLSARQAISSPRSGVKPGVGTVQQGAALGKIGAGARVGVVVGVAVGGRVGKGVADGNAVGVAVASGSGVAVGLEPPADEVAVAAGGVWPEPGRVGVGVGDGTV